MQNIVIENFYYINSQSLQLLVLLLSFYVSVISVTLVTVLGKPLLFSMVIGSFSTDILSQFILFFISFSSKLGPTLLCEIRAGDAAKQSVELRHSNGMGCVAERAVFGRQWWQRYAIVVWRRSKSWSPDVFTATALPPSE